MQEPYEEGPASHLDPESCAGGRKAVREALTGARADTVSSCDKANRGAQSIRPDEGHTEAGATREPAADPAQSQTRRTFGTPSPGTWEIPRASGGASRPDRPEKASSRTSGTHARGKSDGRVVPAKPANEGPPTGPEEPAEGRRPAKGNAVQDAAPRTQSRTRAPTGLQGVREAARRDRRARFTSLLHHVTVEWLRESYHSLNKRAAAGVDGVTWREYGERLEERLTDLHARVHRGSYRAQPGRRVFIPKPDGRQRPLGVAALEDKIVQHAVGVLLSAIYEEDFLGFSYGFRAGRGQHDALDALWVGLMRKKVGWVFDADIRGFFDTIDHGWLMKFVEHRIADPRVLRLIRKWLRAGVLEGGRRSETDVGTPQGAVISPLLANVYLHYAFDLWVDAWRKEEAAGDVIVVRYADDFVLGFERREDAERFQRALCARLGKFGLALHPEKTRLIAFGRSAPEMRGGGGGPGGKPETFDFLGFTHRCGKTRRGRFLVKRTTVAKRFRATLLAVKERLRGLRHRPVPEQGAWLARVIRGWANYHAIPGNSPRLFAFRAAAARHWMKALRRRSQRRHLTWERFRKLERRWIPYLEVLHPWPNVRFDARHPRREPYAGNPLVRICAGGAT